MKKVLFVDDESNILTGLKRMLRGMRKEWDMVFVSSGREALQVMQNAPVDVVVSDVRMPGIDGVELLKKVREQYPKTIRLILSGHSDYAKSLESTSVAHQFLAKPCDADTLRSAIDNQLSLVSRLHNEQLEQIVLERMVLPSAPDLYTRIVSELESDTASLASISQLVEQDMAMTAKILQLVNSAFFGLPREFTQINQAVTYLGVETIKALVLMNGIFTTLSEDSPVDKARISKIWQHGMAVANLAKVIAADMGAKAAEQEKAYIAGMLHDIGKLVLETNLSEQYATIRAEKLNCEQTLWGLENQALGCSHADVGGFLLSLWGLHSSIVETVLYHHEPALIADGVMTIGSAVYFANTLVDAEHDGCLDEQFLNTVASAEQYEHWRQHLK